MQRLTFPTGVLRLQELPPLSSPKLPPELERYTLQFVLPKDLCNVALTSSSMRTFASDPNLWREMKVNREKIKEHGLVQLFSINRFRKIRKIDLSQKHILLPYKKLQSDLNAIASSWVEDLNLEKVDFIGIPPELLTRAMGHLQKVNLNKTDLTNEQILAVLEACSSSSTLIDVSLHLVNLPNIPSQTLAQAIGYLHKVNLNNTFLTSEQILAVLEVCISSSTLIDVSFEGAKLQQITSQILALAVGHLHKMNLNHTDLTNQQILAVLEACISSPTTLVDVSLMGVDLKGIPAEIIALASNKITFNGFAGYVIRDDSDEEDFDSDEEDFGSEEDEEEEEDDCSSDGYGFYPNIRT